MTAPRYVIWLARRLLRLYPRPFRGYYGEQYIAAAEHRFALEMKRGAGRLAGVRTVLALLGDAFVAVPAARWRGWAPARGVGSIHGRGEGGMTRFVFGWMTDFRLAARSLARRPAYSLLVVATLGLGIGASAAVFGALDRVILRPLPYADADRFVYLSMLNRARGWNFAPFDALIDRWREGSRTVERIETYRQVSGTVRGEGDGADVVSISALSAGMPGMLGVRPLVGRMLGVADAERGAPPVLMVSEKHWRGAWGADPDVVGRTVLLNDTVFTVAGVWPDAARLDYEGSPPFFRVVPPDQESPIGDFTLVLARLARGASTSDVEAELATLMRGIEAPENSILGTWIANEDLFPVVNPPYGLLGDSYVRGLWMVFAGAIVLLVVAIFNAANLVLGRSASRTGEIGIRLALGGSTARLVRLFFAESALLATTGVVTAFAVAIVVEQSLARLEPGRLVPAGTTGLQGRATLFALALAVTAAVLCALVPLLHARTGELRDRLTGAGSSRESARPSRLRALIIGAQSALAVLLVTGAALVGRSFFSLLDVEIGLDLEHIAVLSVRAPASMSDSPDAITAFYAPIESALAALPGVTGITTAPNPPLSYSVRGGMPFLEGDPEPVLDGSEFVSSTSVPPGYFSVTGTPLLRGRDFTSGEKGVVIVNDAFARAHDGNVIGRSLRFAGDTLVYTVIGIVGDVRARGLEDDADRAQLYFSDSDGKSAYTRFLLRTAGPPAAALQAARARLAAIYPDIPLLQATTGPIMIRERTARIRFVAFLLAAFAALGILFAIAGVYGSVSLDVSRRAREVSVRMALGASNADVAASTLHRGLRPVAAGAVIGLFAALWAGPVLESILFRIPARDPISVLAGVLVLLAAAVLACVVPARRAARVDPASVLRAS